MIECSWCCEDIKKFYTLTNPPTLKLRSTGPQDVDMNNKPKLFCRPECVESYESFEKQAINKKLYD